MQPLLYRFALPTANHVFLPGHRIMVQIQSSWFPLYDRNPQTFVPNIFNAKPSDYRKATQRIYHAPNQRSFIELPVAEPAEARNALQKDKDPLALLNDRFRAVYAQARKELLAKQGPIIIADGDSVILLRSGQRTEVRVTAMADIVKPISHTPLAIHALLASAGEADLTKERLRELRSIKELIEPAAKSLADRGLPGDIRLLQTQILQESARYLDDVLANKKVKSEARLAFTRKLGPLLRTSANYAASTQCRMRCTSRS